MVFTTAHDSDRYRQYLTPRGPDIQSIGSVIVLGETKETCFVCPRACVSVVCERTCQEQWKFHFCNYTHTHVSHIEPNATSYVLMCTSVCLSVCLREDPDRTEDSNQLLQDIRFKATIRGWSRRTQQHRTIALLILQHEHMAEKMETNQDLILLSTTW